MDQFPSQGARPTYAILPTLVKQAATVPIFGPATSAVHILRDADGFVGPPVLAAVEGDPVASLVDKSEVDDAPLALGNYL